jgi:hypothetical protein
MLKCRAGTARQPFLVSKSLIIKPGWLGKDDNSRDIIQRRQTGGSPENCVPKQELGNELLSTIKPVPKLLLGNEKRCSRRLYRENFKSPFGKGGL